jgi:orotate phosphoribosyltransferase
LSATHVDTASDVESRLERSNALLTGHFQLTSGRHSDRYVQCALLLAQPAHAEAVGRALAERLASVAGARGGRPELVIGPALGGVVIAHEVARALDTPAYFTERKEGVMELRRGFFIKPGVRTVVVEDVVTTGGSVKEVIELVRKAGGRVEAVGSIVHRAKESPFDVPYEALLQLVIESWEPAACPLCKQGSTAIKPGSRPGA